MGRRVRVAILGTGNIGSDLLEKVKRSDKLECALFAGRNPDSRGVRAAKEAGINCTWNGAQALLDHRDRFDLIFDATGAEAHERNGPIFEELSKPLIDLTPSGGRDNLGRIMCIPAVNLEDAVRRQKENGAQISLVSCGGQANIPLLMAIAKNCAKVSAFECVSAVSSKSAGPGTRDSIDEFVQKTSEAIKAFTGVQRAKIILNINPADPPINMHNTIYARVEGETDMEGMRADIAETVERLLAYVPDFRIKVGPLLKDGVITVISEVRGRGDFLPTYAGNLDIMTSAAVAVAEEYAKEVSGA